MRQHVLLVRQDIYLSFYAYNLHRISLLVKGSSQRFLWIIHRQCPSSLSKTRRYRRAFLENEPSAPRRQHRETENGPGTELGAGKRLAVSYANQISCSQRPGFEREWPAPSETGDLA